ncbi:hypothetical protein BIV57_15915 [Mangrovactinospora gilvigrisea]|uniref:Uncharacterized protein n=1 Tax=Mangrovactinospora gilvigrisea TaxID=1428644 RepID=A0A1J7BCY6_9ACTN|nr:hypothetical protein BIV57_15915 [Mangrovactinospora gilvigrisea]
MSDIVTELLKLPGWSKGEQPDTVVKDSVTYHVKLDFHQWYGYEFWQFDRWVNYRAEKVTYVDSTHLYGLKKMGRGTTSAEAAALWFAEQAG